VLISDSHGASSSAASALMAIFSMWDLMRTSGEF
jgi:hypothetical protein